MTELREMEISEAGMRKGGRKEENGVRNDQREIGKREMAGGQCWKGR